MIADVDYIPRKTLAYDMARLGLAIRLTGWLFRRAVRDLVLGLAAR